MPSDLADATHASGMKHSKHPNVIQDNSTRQRSATAWAERHKIKDELDLVNLVDQNLNWNLKQRSIILTQTWLDPTENEKFPTNIGFSETSLSDHLILYANLTRSQSQEESKFSLDLD